jgi:hypothetical protein
LKRIVAVKRFPLSCQPLGREPTLPDFTYPAL